MRTCLDEHDAKDERWQRAVSRSPSPDSNIQQEVMDLSPSLSLGKRFKWVVRSFGDWSIHSLERDTSETVVELSDFDGTREEISPIATPPNKNPIPKAPMHASIVKPAPVTEPAPITEHAPVVETFTTQGGKVDTLPRRVTRCMANANIPEAGLAKLSSKTVPPKKAPVRAPMR